MKFITATSKEAKNMQMSLKLRRFLSARRHDDAPAIHPFRVMVEKEIADQVRSWRFIILLALMALTCMGSLYSAIQAISAVDPSSEELKSFVFLRLFTLSDGTLPSFITFVGFLGPLLGLGLGFDAINTERNKGTLSRLMSQPIHRDYVIAAKFISALAVISAMFVSLGFLVMGIGLLTIGIPPTPEEFLRMISFMVLSMIYVSFWLGLSILFSVNLRQPATSALSSIAVWIFFTVFYGIIVNLLGNVLAPGQTATVAEYTSYQKWMLFLQRLSPDYLFNEATTTLLIPSVRSVGLVSQEQMVLALDAPLPLGQSLLLVWPQLTCLIAGAAICFGISYRLFMRQEIRSRS
jgi:ABC-2 type transport system permease protein